MQRDRFLGRGEKETEMYMRNKKNKIITILMTLILLVCMPVTEVYAGTSTKTYGTDAFGETNGYLRLSQGTIKSCKYSKNGASAKTVKDDKRYVTYYVLSVKLDAPAPCRLDAPDLDLICYASADCLHQHLQVI